MESQRPGVRRMVVQGTRAMLASPGVFLLGAALHALLNHLVLPGASRVWQAAFGLTDLHSLPSVCAMAVIMFALVVPLFYGLHVAALRQMRTGRASVSDLLEGARHYDRAMLAGLVWAFVIGVCMAAVGLLAALLVMLASGTEVPLRAEYLGSHLWLIPLIVGSVPYVLIVPVVSMVMPALADGVPLRRLVYFCPPNSRRHFWPLVGAAVVVAVVTNILACVPVMNSLAIPWFACMMTRAYLDIESERRRQASK